MKKQLTGSISLDMDNMWSYLKTHGDENWEQAPSYIPSVVPVVLDILNEFDLRCTFFLVGKDAADPVNAEALSRLVPAGHETGNHSWNHEPWLHRYRIEDIRSELVRTEEAVIEATGAKPVGFRGPGYSWSPFLLQVLNELGYAFDASTLPTVIGPLSRAYYFLTSNLKKEEREKRNKLFGTVRDGFRPIRPYSLAFRTESGARESILEIPVTTMPVFRLPFHLSYLIWLAGISKKLMALYLWIAVGLCRLFRLAPSVLLHPLDFIGGDCIDDLGFFPGMDRDTEWKLAVARKALGILTKNFELVPMSEHAEKIRQKGVK